MSTSTKPARAGAALGAAPGVAPGSPDPLAVLKPEHRGLWAKPVEDRPLIWVNGKLVPKSEAVVSVYDHGLLYGDGVFEGIRVYKGKIFKLQSHMDRLYRCAEKISLRIPISAEEMVGVQRLCIEANGIEDGYIRLVVTRGYGTLGLDPRKCPVPGVVCIADQISQIGRAHV